MTLRTFCLVELTVLGVLVASLVAVDREVALGSLLAFIAFAFIGGILSAYVGDLLSHRLGVHVPSSPSDRVDSPVLFAMPLVVVGVALALAWQVGPAPAAVVVAVVAGGSVRSMQQRFIS